MKIKILADAHVFDNEFQGTRTFIKEIYLALADKPDLELFLASQHPAKIPSEFHGKPNVSFLKLKSPSGWRRLLIDFPSLIRQHKIDFAHFQYIVPPVKNCRYIVTIHDLIFNDFPKEFSWGYILSKNLLFGISLLRSDIVTTVSAYSRSSIKKYLLNNKKNILLTPNGVSQKFFQPYNRNDSVSYIQERYGIKKLFYMSAGLNHEKITLPFYRHFCTLNFTVKGIVWYYWDIRA